MIFLQLLINGIAIGSMYALVAVGFAIIFSTTRIFHFAHGATFLLAAYSYYYLFAQLHYPAPVAIFFALIMSIAFGFIIERFIYRPMLQIQASFLTTFVASFGVLIVTENALVLGFSSGFQTINSTLSKGKLIGSLVVPMVDFVAVGIALILFVLLQWFMKKTRTGVLLRAMADSAELVDTVGIGKTKYSVFSFLLGSALVAPAAILMIYLTGLSPSSGSWAILIALSATIVGGVGSLPGAALGGLIMGIAENVGVWKLASDWKGAITFGVLLLFLLLRPSGILGNVRR